MHAFPEMAFFVQHGRRMASRDIVFFLMILLPFQLASVGYAQHGSWMDKYRNAKQVRCCGERDCLRVHARILSHTVPTVVAEVNGVVLTMPMASVHTSEDAHDWACLINHFEHVSQDNLRCLFLAVGA